MFGIGTQEMLVIAVMVLLLFGAQRMPEVARAFGKGLRDFRAAVHGVENEIKRETMGVGSDPRPWPPRIEAPRQPTVAADSVTATNSSAGGIAPTAGEPRPPTVEPAPPPSEASGPKKPAETA